MIKKIIFVVALLIVMLSLAGCNTFRGMGKDIQTLGEGVEDMSRAEVRWVGY